MWSEHSNWRASVWLEGWREEGREGDPDIEVYGCDGGSCRRRSTPALLMRAMQDREDWCFMEANVLGGFGIFGTSVSD